MSYAWFSESMNNWYEWDLTVTETESMHIFSLKLFSDRVWDRRPILNIECHCLVLYCSMNVNFPVWIRNVFINFLKSKSKKEEFVMADFIQFFVILWEPSSVFPWLEYWWLRVERCGPRPYLIVGGKLLRKNWNTARYTPMMQESYIVSLPIFLDHQDSKNQQCSSECFLFSSISGR